jgi:hypothetical protein
LTAAGLPLALALALVGADGGRAADVPQPVSGRMTPVRVEPDELTRYLHRVIQEELKAPAPDERAVMKARATALLIAARAQNGRGARDPGQRAALRDNALALQKALAGKRVDAAREHAAALFDMGRMPAGPRRVRLKGLMDLDEVESLMKARQRGGLGFGPPGRGPAGRDGIEVALMNFARKAPAAQPEADGEHLARAASVTAAMADLLDAYAPDGKTGAKDPRDWKTWTAELRTAAEELAAAARARDPNRIHTAARGVTARCASCHSVFRDD